MAANNYFGYTTGGTQFGATPAATYTTNPATAAAGYAAVQHAAQQYAAAPRPSQTGYESYQTATHQTTYQYASRPQTTYDKTQSYYPQSTAQVAYSTADTSHYQTGVTKSTYTMNTNPYGSTTQTRTTTPKTQNAGTTQAPATSYVYSTNTAAGSAANYASSYNAASTTTYPAAAMYAASQTAGGASSAVQGGAMINKTQTGTWGGGGFKKGFVKTQKIKAPPKPQQLHYCEVCKISCAGPQTYREHLEGQKHKKKEAAAKAGNPTPFSRGGASLRCELCDVTCTGQDAYAAHIRGSKHQKVVKLHTKLGKPIPSTDPVVLSTGTTTTTGAKAGAKSSPGAKAAAGANATGDGKKVLGAPKINFVGGTKLKSIGADGTVAAAEEKESDEEAEKEETIDDKSDVQPVGQDYIDEIKNEEGKVISFQCKLCDCRFNDPNAKEMHMKGRRHRLQYKKKVNPDLVVDIKPSLRQRKIQEDRLRRQQIRDELWKRREEDRWREEMRMMEEEERMYWEERRRYEEELEYYDWYRRFGRDTHMLPPPPMPRGPFMGPPMRGPQMMPPRRPDSVDDRHIMSKHTTIYPSEDELNNVQKVVLNTERALKQVSDFLAESDAPKGAKKEVKPKEAAPAEDATETATTNGEGAEKESASPPQPERMMKGVMRVGILSKGLLLTGDTNVQLVVMCSEKPTRTLLDRVADNLPKQFAEICPDDKYEVKPCVEEAAIKVESSTDPKMTVTVTLTSPIMREGADKDGESGESVKDPPDVLDRQKCLAALAALRHAKWFQARASGLQSCVMIIRIMRDLCQRVPTWGRISTWAMELLVEKVISSAGQYLSPGDALRRVFEAVASGLLLPGGSGLLDPCEKEQVDATAHLSNQDREDITASSQYALRLIAFRQIHKVLGMDPLPPPKYNRVPFTRKRRRDNSTSEGNDSEGADGKKDKKEEKAVSENAETAAAGTAKKE